MVKKIAISQSNYIPWKGYFDLIAAVDEFIIYDEMQFTKNDWRNRNKIKTPKGVEWVTVPVGQNINRKIFDVVISDSRWQKKHWRTFEANYRRAPCFEDIASWLEPLYLGTSFTNLSQLNRQLIEAICDYLGIKTLISNSCDYELQEGKSERLASICVQSGAGEYISGPAAKDYIDDKAFTESGIKLTWFNYQGYPGYSQLWGEFTHEVTILDLLFNYGKKTTRYMKYVQT